MLQASLRTETLEESCGINNSPWSPDEQKLLEQVNNSPWSPDEQKLLEQVNNSQWSPDEQQLLEQA